MLDAYAAVVQVRDELAAGTLDVSELSARRLGRRLGVTTSAFYHHFGSFERFLYQVSISGLALMADEMEPLARGPSPLLRIADYYVGFALERPVLFHLMLQYGFSWDQLRNDDAIDEEEGLRAWKLLVETMRRIGSRAPIEDARLFHAALHGIATLTQAGRMNTGDLTHSDRTVAQRSIRRLVRLFASSTRR